MYTKLFSRITESSLMEEPIEVRYTFMMLLAIADPTGRVIGTDIALARRINISLDDFVRCIAALQSPDPDSNSKEEDGRRIVDSDGERGYRVVNFITYRQIKDDNEKREYMREYMRKRREAVKSVSNGKVALTDVTHADADAYADAKEEEDTEERSSPKVEEQGVLNIPIKTSEEAHKHRMIEHMKSQKKGSLVKETEHASRDGKIGQIFNAYPNQRERMAGLKAISKKFHKYGFEFLMGKTKEHARAMRDRDQKFIPLAKNWFRNDGFLEVEKATFTDESKNQPHILSATERRAQIEAKYGYDK